MPKQTNRQRNGTGKMFTHWTAAGAQTLCGFDARRVPIADDPANATCPACREIDQRAEQIVRGGPQR